MAASPKMSSETTQPKEAFHGDEKADIQHAEVLANPDLLHEAFDGENREHELGVWEAAKKHPWACLWAFIMCFTIVSRSLCATASPPGQGRS